MARRFAPIRDVLPVPDVPDRFEELGLAVLVLQVEGVLPRVENEERNPALGEVGLVVVDLGRQKALAERFPDEGQPDPMIVPAPSFICFFSFSKPPKSASIAAASSPCGRPPPFGVRFCQKRECRTWPERWKARDFSRAARRVKSSFWRASSSFSSAVLAPLTYPEWCLS